MLIFGIAVLVVLFAIGTPIYLAFALGGVLLLLFHSGFPLNQLTAIFFNSMNSFVLLAAPLFILAGHLMTHGGLATPLIRLVSSFTGRLPGGVGVAAIVGSAFIGALTGSVMATLATVGIVMFPMMKEANYPRGYSGAILCSSSNLGTLIPPSLFFIVYGFLTGTSVSELFIAGVGPGLLLTVLLSVVNVVIARKKQLPLMPAVTWRERGSLFIKALPALGMPVIILGGIYGGIFTPTEAAAVACVYSIIIGVFFYRKLTWKNMYSSLKETSETVTNIVLLVAGGTLLGKAFILIGFPQAITNLVIDAGLERTGFLLLIALVFVVLGVIMEGMVILFMVLPLIMPIAPLLDINLIHLGVIFCLAVLISGLTPPVALTLYVTGGMFDIPISEIVKEVLPFLIISIVALIIVIFFPQISLWLPSSL